MKNITVSVPDDVYRAAKVRAAERGISLSALVSDYLRRLSGGDEFSRLESEQRRVQKQIKRFRAGARIDRDELHRRAVR